MASQESVRRRQITSDARVSAAVATLAEQAGVEPVVVPRLPGGVDAGFRAMIEREVLAGTLEQLVGVGVGAGSGPDGPLLAVALGLLVDSLDITVEEAETRVRQTHDAMVADQEAERLARETEDDGDETGKGESDGESADGEGIDGPPPEDLDALTRSELNDMATALGVVDAGMLRNKPVVIAAIEAARAAAGGAGAGEGEQP